MGEVQVWDVAKRKLALSVPVTYDTVYGASWSPDGTKIAFGCADNTVRAIDAKTGEQVLFMGSHSDWVLDTVFSADGSHLISVGRDMTAKLTEVATQRFVDNITSITPGALKGGLAAVARHPKRDEIVIGGSDGEPKLYRVFRQTVRVIGDDSNLIREFPALPGRVYSVAVSSDGKRIAAGSSLDGTGEIGVYSYEFDTGLPANIKAINEKVVTARSAAEVAALEKYHKEGVKQIASVKVPQGGIYAVAFRPDGKVLAAAGADGMIRLLNPETGSLVKEFAPVTVKTSLGRPERPGHGRRPQAGREPSRPKCSPKGATLAAPGGPAQGDPADQSVRLRPAPGHRQARLGRDDRRDPDGRAVALRRRSPRSPARVWCGPWPTARRRLALRLAGKSAEVPVTVLGVNTPARGRLRPRRRPGALAAGLQRGDLPRLGPGQERLQALAPRLRPDLRRPRPDRRPRRRGTSTWPRPTTA